MSLTEIARFVLLLPRDRLLTLIKLSVLKSAPRFCYVEQARFDQIARTDYCSLALLAFVFSSWIVFLVTLLPRIDG